MQSFAMVAVCNDDDDEIVCFDYVQYVLTMLLLEFKII